MVQLLCSVSFFKLVDTYIEFAWTHLWDEKHFWHLVTLFVNLIFLGNLNTPQNCELRTTWWVQVTWDIQMYVRACRFRAQMIISVIISKQLNKVKAMISSSQSCWSVFTCLHSEVACVHYHAWSSNTLSAGVFKRGWISRTASSFMECKPQALRAPPYPQGWRSKRWPTRGLYQFAAKTCSCYNADEHSAGSIHW